MGTVDWFRNTIWNKEVEEAFEVRFKRSRGAFHKAQYLRIQADYLLENKDETVQLAGIKLMERMINDYPTEEHSTILGHETLGDYYYKKSDFEKAYKHYLIVADYIKEDKYRGGTSGTADIKLARTILKANWNDKLLEAYNLCKKYPVKKLVFHDEEFAIYEAFALLCYKLDKKDEAKEYAQKALELSKIKKSRFKYHKNVGLVKATDEQIKMLEQIAN